jgi:hypothetical protein
MLRGVAGVRAVGSHGEMVRGRSSSDRGAGDSDVFGKRRGRLALRACAPGAGSTVAPNGHSRVVTFGSLTPSLTGGRILSVICALLQGIHIFWKGMIRLQDFIIETLQQLHGH